MLRVKNPHYDKDLFNQPRAFFLFNYMIFIYVKRTKWAFNIKII